MLRTITPKGTFYFVNSRRVSRDQFNETQFGRRLECFQTTIKNGIIRHYHTAR